MMLMGVVDTVMVGHLAPGDSSVGLAAVALGHLYFFGIGVFGMGTLMVLDPVVAQAVGARDPAARRARHPAGRAARAHPGRAVDRRSCSWPARSSGWPTSPPEVVPLAAAYTVRLAPGRAAVLPVHRVPAEPAGAASDRARS